MSVHKPGFSETSVGENHGECGVCGIEGKWWGNMKEISTWRTLLKWNFTK
jgi:hypothetical protein